MWLLSFINQILPQPDGLRLLSWCDFDTNSTRRWKLIWMLWIKILHIPAEFLYIQTCYYNGLVTTVVCPLPLIVL